MNHFRRRRFTLFFELLQLGPTDSILDVGGLPYDWVELGFTGHVVCAGLSPLREGCWGNGNIRYVRQDARCLPYEDRAFDVVYSNSLIEHVGKENQRAVASEIARVGRRYWVQTPNKLFPIEPHYWFPFFYSFPHSIRRKIAQYWTPMIRRRNCYLDEVDSISPLTRCDLQALFPDSTILVEKWMGFSKSFIAVRQ